MASQQQHIQHSPTSFWQSWSFWLRVLGVGLALVGAIATGVLLNSAWGVVTIVIAPIIGFGSACLLRSWWAMLIVPVVFSVGIFLGFALSAGGFDQLHIGASDFLEGVYFAAILGVVPVIVGALVGVPIGKWLVKRVQH